MNNHERISQMIPEYINGTLSQADTHIVEEALASSDDLQHKHDEYVTSIAACLLLWIGINEKTPINVEKSEIMKIPSIELAETIDEYTPLELQSEDVEEVILDEILTVYVSDIESGKEINPLLEKEITNYLLQENADEEVL